MEDDFFLQASAFMSPDEANLLVIVFLCGLAAWLWHSFALQARYSDLAFGARVSKVINARGRGESLPAMRSFTQQHLRHTLRSTVPPTQSAVPNVACPYVVLASSVQLVQADDGAGGAASAPRARFRVLASVPATIFLAPVASTVSAVHASDRLRRPRRVARAIRAALRRAPQARASGSGAADLPPEEAEGDASHAVATVHAAGYSLDVPAGEHLVTMPLPPHVAAVVAAAEGVQGVRAATPRRAPAPASTRAATPAPAGPASARASFVLAVGADLPLPRTLRRSRASGRPTVLPAPGGPVCAAHAVLVTAARPGADTASGAGVAASPGGGDDSEASDSEHDVGTQEGQEEQGPAEGAGAPASAVVPVSSSGGAAPGASTLPPRDAAAPTPLTPLGAGWRTCDAALTCTPFVVTPPAEWLPPPGDLQRRSRPLPRGSLKPRILRLERIFGFSHEPDEDDSRDCVVCMTEPRVVALLPCRHLCVCSECFAHLDKCPFCRTPFSAYLLMKHRPDVE